MIDKPITAPDGQLKWIYSPPENTQSKLILLQREGCAVVGKWEKGLGWIAWCPLPQRDKEKEIELGYREKP